MDINAEDGVGGTALIWAGRNGHTDVVVYLLGMGANPRLQMSNGWTVLHIAAKNSNWETLTVLLGAMEGQTTTL